MIIGLWLQILFWLLAAIVVLGSIGFSLSMMWEDHKAGLSFFYCWPYHLVMNLLIILVMAGICLIIMVA